MKKAFIDPGNFYTKVCVFERKEDGSYCFFGRTFFPSAVSKVGAPSRSYRCYEHEGGLYQLGYDSSGIFSQSIAKVEWDSEYSWFTAILTLKKIIFDYADEDSGIELNIVLDTQEKIETFKHVAGKFMGEPVTVRVMRGYDRPSQQVTKKVVLNFLSVGDGIYELARKVKNDFSTALIVDIGHDSSKIYIVNSRTGVEEFRIIDFGVNVYYESIIRHLVEKRMDKFDYYWLIKQVELGFSEIEVGSHNRDVDISLIIDNIKWDLNKDFLDAVSGIVSHYYENRVEWAQMLVITGGGALLSGELLQNSLMAGGYTFNDIYVEKSPMYALVEAAGYGAVSVAN
ncbi:MAG: hypothetical protein HQK54_11210 [Oligoflexales bacterium]|nr:hypothetical protein [Oligoflexales bacterium]